MITSKGDRMKNNEIAKIFKALGDERRIEILHILVHGEKCACNLLDELAITQPTLSHHMKILCEAGIVQARKEGKWTHYSVSKDGSDIVRELVESIVVCDEREQKVTCSCGNAKNIK